MKTELSFSVGEGIGFSLENISGNNMPRSHSHDSYEMYLLLSGERYLFAKDDFYSLRAGDAFLISPGIEHRTLDSGDKEYSRMTLMIPRHLMPSDCVYEGGVHIIHSSEEIREIFFACAEELKKLFYLDTRGRAARAASVVMKMLSVLVCEPRCEGIENASPMLERVSEILGYMEKHYQEPITLTSLSTRFFISEYYLCRIFKEHTGRTVLEYLNALRLKRAAELLVAGGKSVGEVRRLSGFGSDSAFGKAFRREYGISPSRYARLT